MLTSSTSPLENIPLLYYEILLEASSSPSNHGSGLDRRGLGDCCTSFSSFLPRRPWNLAEVAGLDFDVVSTKNLKTVTFTSSVFSFSSILFIFDFCFTYVTAEVVQNLVV